VNIGAVTVGIAVIAILVWAAVLLNSARTRRSRAEEAPPNLQPYLTDDELENRRLDKVLLYALIGAAVLAIVLPIYFLNEPGRQADASEGFEERDIEEGEHWFEEFGCVGCHGVGAVGGGATFVEPRSGIEVTWAAPSLNDVFWRYEPDEARFWIEYGRAGTPMPALGLVGGGAMTEQQIDQVLAYLASIQISQEEAFAKVEPGVSQAEVRFATAEESVAAQLVTQEEQLVEVLAAPDTLAAVEDIPQEIAGWLSGVDSCTDASAALVLSSCTREGQDSDRDGVTDAAEVQVESLLAEAAEASGDEALAIALDPLNAFSNSDAAGQPIEDLVAINEALTELNTIVLNLEVTAANQDLFIESTERGIAFLESAAAEQRWTIDIERIADEAFGGDVAEAERAASLYNSLCARCHTAGYSAGQPFTEEAGSGAWAPALVGGRSVTQFPDVADQVEFIKAGSELGVNYGVFGVGRGWMPGFGLYVSEADIERIVAFERSL
jgi:mono/diheme cytochrome c family protein